MLTSCTEFALFESRCAGHGGARDPGGFRYFEKVSFHALSQDHVRLHCASIVSVYLCVRARAGGRERKEEEK
jgi:hypothetical protein